MNRTFPRPVRTLVPAAALCVALAPALTACGSDAGTGGGTADNGSASASASATPAAGSTLKITIQGGSVTPTNKRVPVDLKQGLTLVITADQAGELHVHSSPEQHVEFGKGTTTKKLTFTVPGVIEVEDHATDTLIAQLEVR